MSSLTLIAGGMYGEKSAKLISRATALSHGGVGFQAFRPDRSLREGDNEPFIFARDAGKIPAQIFSWRNPFEILDALHRRTEAVLIDEIHMVDDSTMMGTIRTLVEMGIETHVAGLTLDAGGRTWPVMAYVFGLKPKLVFSYGICKHPTGCRNDGTHSQLFYQGEIAPYAGQARISAGAGREEDWTYEPRCFKHWKEPPLAEGYEDLGTIIPPVVLPRHHVRESPIITVDDFSTPRLARELLGRAANMLLRRRGS